MKRKNKVLSQEHAAAALHCLEHGVPFIVYALPGENTTHFLAGDDTVRPRSARHVDIAPWNSDPDDIITIHDVYSATDVLAINTPAPAYVSMEPADKSTNPLLHKAQVKTIVKFIKHELDDGKIVLSRVEATDNRAPRCNEYYVKAASYMFNDTESFRYILYTPRTGGWMASTPELLLEANLETGTASTMSLAGTRNQRYEDPDDETFDDETDELPIRDLPWDDKNLHEHDMVTQFILDTLERHGIVPGAVTRTVKRNGMVEHLCDNIEFEIAGVNPHELLADLHPTPAIGGFPRDVALEVISHYEAHQRHLYGGYISVEDGKSLHAYVNLRCMHFFNDNYTLYAGGGITAQSTPIKEWNETDCKLMTMKVHLINAMYSS